jgi:PAS domain S-box-containing protein
VRRELERFRGLFEQASDLMLLHDRSGSIIDANRHACESLGYSREEMQRLTINDLDRGLDPDRANISWSPSASDTPTTFDTAYRRKDGSTIDVEARFTALETSRQILLLSTARDVTERRRTEQALRECEVHYRRIVETALEGILVKDAMDRITLVNQRVLEILDYAESELLGCSLHELLAPESRPFLVVKERETPPGARDHRDVRIRRKDGSDLWVTVSASALLDPEGRFQGTFAMITDISERRRAEDELFQAQKLESVGRLAAGIAHEINTPIQFVGDNVHFLTDTFTTLWDFIQSLHVLGGATAGVLPGVLTDQLRVAEENADLEYLGVEIPRALAQTLEGVERVASIVRALKSFAHPDRQEKVAVDLNQMLSSTLIVARNEIKYVAEVETTFGELPPVFCHPGAVNQVFLNLLVNAAHALADRADMSGDRAVIRVRTSQEGTYAIVAIEDTGCGIPESIRMKVFDQFFTTKEVGRGTGQGLALAHRIIVDQHDGALSFESKEGVGTTFFVRLPLHAIDRPQTAAS